MGALQPLPMQHSINTNYKLYGILVDKKQFRQEASSKTTLCKAPRKPVKRQDYQG